MTKLTAVEPLTPLAPYLGGKRNLARHIIQRIDAIPHDCYAEVFVGMAGVFLRRHQAPKSEVINDYSRDVATFFRILQRHYVAFMDMMRFQLTTRVEFECLSYEKFITRYDRPGTLFYLDPPYWGNEGDYGKGMFGRPDFMKLVILLHQIEGRFLFSINDRPEVRDLFAGFNIEPVETTYTVAKGGAKRVGELIISNV